MSKPQETLETRLVALLKADVPTHRDERRERVLARLLPELEKGRVEQRGVSDGLPLRNPKWLVPLAVAATFILIAASALHRTRGASSAKLDPNVSAEVARNPSRAVPSKPISRSPIAEQAAADSAERPRIPAKASASRPHRDSQAKASTHPSASGIVAELAFLDSARSALKRGSPEEALEALTQHAASFPHGGLEQEREALAVRALAEAGRSAEARERGARFAEHYPESALLVSVQKVLASIP